MNKVCITFSLILFFFVSKAQWSTSGTNISNTNTGNVGIGTSSPMTKLHVKGTVNPLLVETSGSGTSIANTIGYEISNSNPTVGNWAGVFFTGTPNANAAALIGIKMVDRINNYGDIGFATRAADGFLERMRILANGNAGIGTTLPRSKVEIIGDGRFSSSATGSSFFLGSSGLPSDHDYSNVRLVAGSNEGGGYLKTKLDNWGGYFTWTRGSANGEVEIMRIDATSCNVGINTADTKGYRLAVNGSAVFTKAVVKQYGSWPDYVFTDTYKLPSLKEVETFIKKHKHLPDVPSAQEIEREGIDLGNNQAILLKKIEELTRYVIELKKENEEIKNKLINYVSRPFNNTSELSRITN